MSDGDLPMGSGDDDVDEGMECRGGRGVENAITPRP